MFWEVSQAHCCYITSLGKCRALGVAHQDWVQITSSLLLINSALRRAPPILDKSSVTHQRVLCLDGVSAVPGLQQDTSGQFRAPSGSLSWRLDQLSLEFLRIGGRGSS